MKETRLQNFLEFHQIIETFDVRTFIYRGVKSAKFPLIPKLGRIVPPDSVSSREENEQEILRLFKERAFQYLDFIPTNDWDWLAIGQQYRLPTRLLDWTDNPLVTCFFATREPGDGDGVIYAYQNDRISRPTSIPIHSSTRKWVSSFPSISYSALPTRADYSPYIPIPMNHSNPVTCKRSSSRTRSVQN